MLRERDILFAGLEEVGRECGDNASQVFIEQAPSPGFFFGKVCSVPLINNSDIIDKIPWLNLIIML